MISPHGTTLVERAATIRREELKGAEAIVLDAVATADLEMLAVGGYSPLTGFMGSQDALRVAQEMRLASGPLWPIPVTLGAPAAQAKRIKVGARLPLADESGVVAGLIDVAEVFERDPAAECRAVFGTDSDTHPGVAQVVARGRFCVAGPVQMFPPQVPPPFAARRLTPRQTRAEFEKRGWQTVVGFQTRNPVHRAHEYIIKCALETCDGLLLHPLVGFTKSDDIPADVRMRCYEALIDAVMVPARVLLSVLPAPMRYGGPREAVLHAIVRKNYGCTHFIVGRDHAGVGSFYGTYDAQKIFDTLPADGLEIRPLKFENSFWCTRCGQMATSKTCPHQPADHLSLSGTKVRELLQKGERPPVEFSRAEIADILITWARAS